jgi:hypothetical protein
LTHFTLLPESPLPLAGKGLFAKKAYHVGDVVSIAPVLTLQREMVEKSRIDSVLMNYCLTLSGNVTDVTLFPLHNAVLINHGAKEKANLKARWFDWSSIPSEGSYFEHLSGNALDLKTHLSQSPAELFAAPFAHLDIAYIATRDIAAGEELLFYYGDSWVAAWESYLMELTTWLEERKEEIQRTHSLTTSQLLRDGRLLESVISSLEAPDDIPRFRAFIELEGDLFPAHWMRHTHGELHTEL